RSLAAAPPPPATASAAPPPLTLAGFILLAAFTLWTGVFRTAVLGRRLIGGRLEVFGDFAIARPGKFFAHSAFADSTFAVGPCPGGWRRGTVFAPVFAATAATAAMTMGRL